MVFSATTSRDQLQAEPRRGRGMLVILLTILVSAFVSHAATPEDYKGRVESARLEVEVMLQDLDSMSEANRSASIESIRRDVPATERVEWSSGSIETQNGWLAQRMDELSAAKDKKKQREILVDISERLLAISESAGELADNLKAAEGTKDQDKQKLAEILSRQEYQKAEAKEESLFQKWWREFLAWLEKMFPAPNLQPGNMSGLESLKIVLQVLVIAAVIGFVGFLLYRFLPFFEGRFGRKRKDKKGDRVILGELIGEDESASDLFSEAEQLARSGDLRSAIRKGYIAALCDLSDRKMVRLARHKTNRDYLRDVRKHEPLFESLSGLTFNFENNWYGLRTAEQADWEDFREGYKRTIENARKSK
ncbi:MAG: DUF4129 domain-containing protein [Pyrinomonadaceae bacterium]